jgi:hypothetical protein
MQGAIIVEYAQNEVCCLALGYHIVESRKIMTILCWRVAWWHGGRVAG